MSDTYTPDPFKNFTPRGNPAQVVKSMPNTEQIDEATLTALAMMTHADLITLIKRVAGAMWGVGIMSDEEKANAILDRLAVISLTSDAAKDVVASAREYFDRKQGKPAQSVEMTVKDRGVDALTTNKLIALESQLARLSGNQALVIPPMPEKLPSD